MTDATDTPETPPDAPVRGLREEAFMCAFSKDYTHKYLLLDCPNGAAEENLTRGVRLIQWRQRFSGDSYLWGIYPTIMSGVGPEAKICVFVADEKIVAHCINVSASTLQFSSKNGAISITETIANHVHHHMPSIYDLAQIDRGVLDRANITTWGLFVADNMLYTPATMVLPAGTQIGHNPKLGITSLLLTMAEIDDLAADKGYEIGAGLAGFMAMLRRIPKVEKVPELRHVDDIPKEEPPLE